MKDICLQNGELVLENGDLQLISNDDCLLQDLRSKMCTSKGALFYDIKYGAGILNFIHQTVDDNTILSLKQQVSIALNDNRIEMNSIDINISPIDSGVNIEIDFFTRNGESLTLTQYVPMRI